MIWIANIVDICATFLEIYLSCYFVGRIVDSEKYKKEKYKFIIVVVLVGIIDELVNKFVSYGAITTIVGLMCLCLPAYLVLRKKLLKCVSMGLVYAIIIVLIDYAIIVLGSLFSGVDVSAATEINYFRIACTLVSKTLLILVTVSLSNIIAKDVEITIKHSVLIFIISLIIMIVAFWDFQMIYASNSSSISGILVFVLLLILSLGFFFYVIKLEEVNHEKNENLRLNVHNEMMMKSLDESEKSFEVWSQRIHDYKNQIIYMQELTEQKKFDELSKCLDEELGEIKKNSMVVKSGYPGIDAIINSKYVYAVSQGVNIFCNIKLPEGIELDNMKIATILGNLIDNSVRGAVSVPGSIVEINIYMMESNMCIKVVNSSDTEKIDFENSDKEHKDFHGIGLKSVKKCTEELGGSFVIECRNGKVTAFVVLFDVI